MGAVALAETPTPSSTPTTQQQTPTKQQSPRTNYGQVFVTKLAAALNIDQATLESKIKQAESDTVDQAVANGDLAKNQADAVKQRVQQGGQGFGMPFGGFGFGDRGERGRGPGRGPAGFAAGVNPQAVMQAVATKLGFANVQDLQTELKSGKTLSDIAKEKNVSQADLNAAAAAAVKTQLDAAVTAGKLTQQQEDAILGKVQQGAIPGMLWNGQGMHKPAPKATATPGASS
jgi:hypothetical protein